MDDSDLRCLEIEQNFSDIAKILQRFIGNNAQSFTFEDLNKNNRRQKLFNIIFQLLDNAEATVCHKYCLDCLRILSRDKSELNELLDEKRLSTLLRLSCLYTSEESALKINEIVNNEIMIASVKALCNIVYNSPTAMTMITKTHTLEGIILRLRMYRDPGVHPIIKLFDMKLMFLITALAPETRPRLKEELHGLTYLTETLDLILKESTPINNDSHHVCLKDDDVDLSCEILKVLFNLMTKRVGDEMVDEEEEALCLRLTSILHDVLLSEAASDKKDELRSHTVNLLTSIPNSCYTELTTPTSVDLPKQYEFDGRNIEAVEVLVQFLSSRLISAEKSKCNLELLSPILSVMVQISRYERVVRKYLRYKVLPPLKDVLSRPEQADTLRGRLCRLLTAPSSTVKDLTAEFLFVLCKENVNRMIKYTGYGNAAGMFANRGLLLGGPAGQNSSSSYSSEDSDSDTEEYNKYVTEINPVVGCYESPRINPLDGMSEEQKEYEAVKLANMMDQLAREGVVKPCRVGEDGRPEPVEHILQLQEDLPRQQVKNKK